MSREGMPASRKKTRERKEKKTKEEKSKESKKRKRKRRMFYVAPSALVAGFGFNLARMFPDLAREAKLRGLFALRGVEADTTIGEYHGHATDDVGPYTMRFLDGRMIDPSSRCLARYANFARSRKEANARFVQRGDRVFLVAKRAIGAGEEVLTYKAHEPPVHPTRDARRAYAHIERAKEYALSPETRGKALRHARRAKELARDALLAFGAANDEAFGFGARTKQGSRKSTGGMAPVRAIEYMRKHGLLLPTGGGKKPHRYESCAQEIAAHISSPKHGYVFKGKVYGKASPEPKAESAESAKMVVNDRSDSDGDVSDDRAYRIKLIQKLDELYATHEVNKVYVWKRAGDDAANIAEFARNVRGETYQWHGGFSFQRMMAQYAAKHELTTEQCGMEGDPMTAEALLKADARKFSDRDYFTYCLVSGLHHQPFGYVFTAQPHLDTKPMNEHTYKKDSYAKPRPDCIGAGSLVSLVSVQPISKLPEELVLIDGKGLHNATELIERFIASNALVLRHTQLEAYDLRFDKTLSALDGRLRRINEGNMRGIDPGPENKGAVVYMVMDRYTSGGAGGSTRYAAMRNQALKCFGAFLPMIEDKLRDDSSDLGKDEIRARAMSYAAVSHGLDPKHLIAARYAMLFERELFETTEANEVMTELFSGNGEMPLTKELMRTRIFASILVMDSVDRLYEVPAYKDKLESHGFGARSKQTARKSLNGTAPRQALARKAAQISRPATWGFTQPKCAFQIASIVRADDPEEDDQSSGTPSGEDPEDDEERL